MSEIILDTITGKSTATTITIGSTPVVSASANSMTIRGEGSNQTSIQQGLLKLWINFQSDGTVDDSLNVSSTTDSATAGITTINNTNNMASTSYAFLAGGSDYDNYMCTATLATNSFPTYSRTDTGAVQDARGYVATSGDLS